MSEQKQKVKRHFVKVGKLKRGQISSHKVKSEDASHDNKKAKSKLGGSLAKNASISHLVWKRVSNKGRLEIFDFRLEIGDWRLVLWYLLNNSG